jgi:uracil-DNA glycosylase family 4
MVVGRGTVPADVLFLGEGPGKSEDLLGEPFVGPSGRLLDALVRDATALSRCTVRYYITNVVLCHPTDTFAGDNRQPTAGEVLACTSNVMHIYRKVQPRVVVFVGKVAEQFYRKEFRGGIRILHPAFILRSGGDKSGYYQQTARQLADIFTKVKEGEHGEA